MDSELRPLFVLGTILVVGTTVSVAIEEALNDNVNESKQEKTSRIVKRAVSVSTGVLLADIAIGLADTIYFKTQR
jgi:hypothetical protein